MINIFPDHMDLEQTVAEMLKENSALSARVEKLEKAIREHGKCAKCGGDGVIVYEDENGNPSFPLDCHSCETLGLAPWALEALQQK